MSAPPLSGLAALFRLRPDRAADYLQAKGLQLTGPYWELDGPAHRTVFTVANLAKLDVLADIKGAMQQAIDSGQTEPWFKAQLVDTLKAKGWWGPQVVVDPDTQEARIVQAGSLRRLQTIYRTNLQSAYMAGRHRQALEQRDRAPWAQYLAVMDQRTRPAHGSLHGKVFALESAAWSVVSPPNGYNCRCRARYFSDQELADRGLKPALDVQLLERDPPGRRPTDPLTGETPARWVQRGVSVADPTQDSGRAVLYADPGWDHLPGSDGAERALVERVLERAGGFGPRMAAQLAAVLRSPPSGARAKVVVGAVAGSARQKVVQHGLATGGNELAIAIDETTGAIIDTVPGGPGQVTLSTTILAALDDPARAVRLIHNHPSGGSLSLEDLSVATRPGAAQVEAVGHDGSTYRAKSLVTDIPRLNALHDVAWLEAATWLPVRAGHGGISLEAKAALELHVINLALADAGVITYRAVLSAPRQALWDAYRDTLRLAVARASAAIKGELP